MAQAPTALALLPSSPFSSNDAQVYSLEAPRGFILDPSPAATRPLLSWISAIPQPLREASLLLWAAHPRWVEVTAGRSSAQLIWSPTPTCARKELSPHRLLMGKWQSQAAPCGPSWARDRRARNQAASGSHRLKAEGEIRLGRGKEKVKAGAPPTPTPFARVSNFLCLFTKNQFSGPGGGGVGPVAAVRGADS